MLEYIGGDLSSKILELMPRNSEMLVIGCLTNDPITINPSHILYNFKTVRAFTTPWWLSQISADEKRRLKNLIAEDYNSN
jgi:hypothetical protein